MLREPTVEELRINYSKFDDTKLIRLATAEAAKLRPEALEVLKEELRARGLEEYEHLGMDLKLKQVDEGKVQELVNIIQSLPCPACGSNQEALSAGIATKALSFIFITHYTKKLHIACPGCLGKKVSGATFETVLLGWWGIPWGIVRSIQAIIANSKMKNIVKNRQQHNPELTSFVLERVGLIELHKNDLLKLSEILKQQHRLA